MPLVRKKNIDKFTHYDTNTRVKEFVSKVQSTANFIAKKSKRYSSSYSICNSIIAKYIKDAINKETKSE